MRVCDIHTTCYPISRASNAKGHSPTCWLIICRCYYPSMRPSRHPRHLSQFVSPSHRYRPPHKTTSKYNFCWLESYGMVCTPPGSRARWNRRWVAESDHTGQCHQAADLTSSMYRYCALCPVVLLNTTLCRSPDGHLLHRSPADRSTPVW